MNATPETVLRLIAEGYFDNCHDDRFVVVRNPNYDPTNGDDPFIVHDCYPDAVEEYDSIELCIAELEWATEMMNAKMRKLTELLTES